jgi:hypothetical protein
LSRCSDPGLKLYLRRFLDRLTPHRHLSITPMLARLT